MGQVIVRDLRETAQACEVVIADFNEAKAQELADQVGGGVTAVKADLRDHSNLVAVLKNAFLVINSTPYSFNVSVMNAALEAGCHYMDLGGLFHVTKEQLKLHDQFASRNLLAVLGMGAAPGMTNVMAAEGARRLDKIDAIDIAVGCIDFVEVDHPLCPPYALDTILDEYTKEPMVFENGRYLAKPPMSGEINLDLPAPVGKCKAILTLHSEVLTIPQTYESKEIKNVTFRLGLPTSFHDKLKLLVDIGLGSPEAVTVDGAAVTPRKVLAKLLEKFPAPQQDPDDAEVVRVDVAGSAGGKKQTIRLETIVRAHKRWKLSCGALDTGVPPSIVAQLIAGGMIKERGVLAPEQCVPVQPLFDELAKRDIKITTQVIAPDHAAARA